MDTMISDKIRDPEGSALTVARTVAEVLERAAALLPHSSTVQALQQLARKPWGLGFRALGFRIKVG